MNRIRCAALLLLSGCAAPVFTGGPKNLEESWPVVVTAWQAANEIERGKGNAERSEAFTSFSGQLNLAFHAAGLYEPRGEDEKLLGSILSMRFRDAAERAFQAPSEGDFFYRAWKHFEWHILGAFKDLEEFHRDIDRHVFGLDERDPDRYGGPPAPATDAAPDPTPKIRRELLDAMGLLRKRGALKESATETQQWRSARLYLALERQEPYPAPQLSPQALSRIREMILNLASDDISTRDGASRELMELGEPAIRPLIEATDGSDPETRARIRQIVSPRK